MRVVVTGATGNVGTAVVRALAADPAIDSIVGVARRLPEEHPLPNVDWRRADVAEGDLARAFAGADVVVHLAWLIQPSRDRSLTRWVNVEGSRRVFEAAAAADAAIVHASSVGAYAPGPKDRAVDESWPTTGVETSFYARDKAACEAELDRLEAERPELRIVRLRPGLIFQRAAAQEIRRLFVGPFLPNRLVDPRLLPFVPDVDRLRFQAVHADDVAEAYRLAVVGDVRGAFNVAADPVLDPAELGRILDARPVRVPAAALRALALATWKLHLQPTPPGWLDLALGVPVMDTTRARTELGWTPRHDAGETLLELLEGMREGSGGDSPPLHPKAGGPFRIRELLTGVGRRNP